MLKSEQVVARTIFGGPVVLTGLAETGISAEVCVDCGHIELKATQLAKLEATYAAHQPLHLKA
jgi:hypothetical protein